MCMGGIVVSITAFEKSKEEYCMTHKQFMKLKFQCPQIKLYWRPTTPRCVRVA